MKRPMMRWALVALLVLGGTAAALLAQGSAPADEKPEDVKSRASYGIGWGFAKNMSSQGLEVSTEMLLRGIQDALSGADSLFSDEQMQAAIQQMQQEWQAAQTARMQELGAKNAAEGAAFLAANAEKEGVVTLDSGLQYTVLESGDGPIPTAQDRVTVDYRGSLLDGSEFDSSYARGEPATFPLQGVIPGWVEALQLMPVGSKWKLFIPASLAYGERGAGGKIGPNATLIFEVELLGIEPAETASVQ